MIHSATPAQAGVREEALQRFMAAMKRDGVNLHAVLMAKGENLFFEKYWAPFKADTIHRMYSVTKSFVSIAVGCLLDEGKISLSDPIIHKKGIEADGSITAIKPEIPCVRRQIRDLPKICQRKSLDPF